MKNTLLSNISWGFAKRYRITLLFLVILLIVGGLSYTTLLKREGFPPINVPIAAVQGTYFANDADKVDKDVIEPISRAISTVDGVDTYTATAGANFYNVFIQFDESVDAETGANDVATAIKEQAALPDGVENKVSGFDPSKFDNKYNLLLAVYDKQSSDTKALETKAQNVAESITAESAVESAQAIPVIETVTNPATGKLVERQTSINKVGIKENGELKYYPAVTIGVVKAEGIDAIELSKSVQSVIQNSDGSSKFDGVQTSVTADFATTINQQIGSLQSSLISGLIAVMVVAILLISWRAALVIAVFIPTVLASTFLGLGLFGFTLNTITLFAVILTLGLFVDDATIIVEAIDSQRKNKAQHKKAIQAAINRVGLASLAGTLTTLLVFTPMLLVSGILGTFIRLLPLTVILALSLSFIISIIVVPFLARPLVLSGKKNKRGFLDRLSLLLPFERKLGRFFGSLPLILKTNKKNGRSIAAGAVGLSVVAILGASLFASKLPLDIFPQAKDSNILQAEITFAPNTDIKSAQKITDKVDESVRSAVGQELTYVTYLTANERSATIEIGLTPFGERKPTSHEIVDNLEKTGETIDGAKIKYGQRDAGPPSSEFPFEMRVYATDDETLQAAADDLKNFLQKQSVELSGGKSSKIAEVKVDGLFAISRTEKGRFVTVSARYDNQDSGSDAVIKTEDLVTNAYNEQRLASLGLAPSAFDFDVSQESENNDSFSSIGTGLVVALAAMYLLLVLLFNSFSQPLLILMAIPFSLFGVFFGLWATDNSLSFFVMLGILGLIGVAVNNTILLTEYANQEKYAGADRYEAISKAITERIRPLITTTLTTVFALLPLALNDPFWQSLAFTLIFGMLSSTILIITSFPYYYLFFEWAREWKNAKFPSLQ